MTAAQRERARLLVQGELTRLLAGTACWYPGSESAEPRCAEPAAFSVLRRDFDPIRPDPARDHLECCREHLPVTVELTDESADSGCVVAVSVLSGTIDRLAAELAAAGSTS